MRPKAELVIRKYNKFTSTRCPKKYRSFIKNRTSFTSCLHGNDENDHENVNIWIRNPKWIDLKTQRNENGTIWKRIRLTGALDFKTKVVEISWKLSELCYFLSWTFKILQSYNFIKTWSYVHIDEHTLHSDSSNNIINYRTIAKIWFSGKRDSVFNLVYLQELL